MGKKTARLTSDSPCPCGSGLALSECCARYHAGEVAPTPEALMRSRYTAYVLGLDHYILETWDPAPDVLFAPGEARPKWLGLTVEATHTEGDQGTVTFVAKGRTHQGAFRMRETSLFERRNGRWFYVKALDEPAA